MRRTYENAKRAESRMREQRNCKRCGAREEGSHGKKRKKWRMSTVSPARVMSLSRSPPLTTRAAGSWHGNRRGEPFPGWFGQEKARECWRGWKETERCREMEGASRRQTHGAHGSLTCSVLLWQHCQFTPLPPIKHTRSCYPLRATNGPVHAWPLSFVVMIHMHALA